MHVCAVSSLQQEITGDHFGCPVPASAAEPHRRLEVQQGLSTASSPRVLCFLFGVSHFEPASKEKEGSLARGLLPADEDGEVHLELEA